MADRGDVTRLLDAWSAGDSEALVRLMPLVVDDLRRLADRQFQRESSSHTLQPTALVSELYLHLVGRRRVCWDSRVQFFVYAAQAMRRILVDHARRRQAVKRGGGLVTVSLSEVLPLPGNKAPQLLALDEALRRLQTLDPTQAQIVELRFFAGLTNGEIARALGLGLTKVKLEWKTARLWLLRQLAA